MNKTFNFIWCMSIWLVFKYVTRFAEKPQRRHALVKLIKYQVNQCTVYWLYFIPFPDNNNLVTYYKIVNKWTKGRAETCEMKVPLSPPKRQAPREHKNNRAYGIRFYCLISWLVAIKICLAYFYNLRANRNDRNQI